MFLNTLSFLFSRNAKIRLLVFNDYANLLIHRYRNGNLASDTLNFMDVFDALLTEKSTLHNIAEERRFLAPFYFEIWQVCKSEFFTLVVGFSSTWSEI